MGSSVIFNLKGVILLELPGPRLLLMMKAKLLAVIPELKTNATGVFLAVIDLDFGRGTLTIGLSIDFNIDPLLAIKIPVEAFFNFNDTSDWHLYLGQYANQIQAKVFKVFDAIGYLMLSGNGIPAHAGLPQGRRLLHRSRPACVLHLGRRSALRPAQRRLRRRPRLHPLPRRRHPHRARLAPSLHH